MDEGRFRILPGGLAGDSGGLAGDDAPSDDDRALAALVNGALAPLDADCARRDVAPLLRPRLQELVAAETARMDQERRGAPRATPSGWYAAAATFAAGALLAVHLATPPETPRVASRTAAAPELARQRPGHREAVTDVADVSFRKVDGGVEVIWNGVPPGGARAEYQVRKCATPLAPLAPSSGAPQGRLCSDATRVRGGRWLDTTPDPGPIVFYVIEPAG